MEIRGHTDVLLAGAVIVALAAAGGCGGDEERLDLETAQRPLPDQIISGFRITETSAGRKDWAMAADQALVFEQRNLLEARRMEVTFFGDSGEVRSVLRADLGRIDRNTDDMEARGNVVVEAADGATLETEKLNWDSGSRKIYSDDSVKVIRDRDVLTGWGFRGDPDLGSFRILRNMRATIKQRRRNAEGVGESVEGP
jgi:LPS export ABC transporter protein LptC